MRALRVLLRWGTSFAPHLREPESNAPDGAPHICSAMVWQRR